MKVFSSDLPSGWHWVTDGQQRREVEAELSRELPQQHVLFGRAVRLLARHDRRDDFLFRVEDATVAQVHLTWTVETDPFFPHTEVHPSLEEWAKSGGTMR
jgi:hypothetical protein